MVRRETVWEFACALAARYQRGSKAAKGRVLDAFCAATVYHRVRARAPLRSTAGPAPGDRRAAYEAEAARLLQLCWEVADRICGKRLAPFCLNCPSVLSLGHPADRHDRGAIAEVSQMSTATVDWLPAPEQVGRHGRGRSPTEPGTLLEQQISI